MVPSPNAHAGRQGILVITSTAGQLALLGAYVCCAASATVVMTLTQRDGEYQVHCGAILPFPLQLQRTSV